MRTLIATLTLTLLAGPLAAQGWIEPLPNVLGGGVSKVRTAVHVTVTGRIAQVEVEEWFRNDGGILGEGDYVYPLPGEAVFSTSGSRSRILEMGAHSTTRSARPTPSAIAS